MSQVSFLGSVSFIVVESSDSSVCRFRGLQMPLNIFIAARYDAHINVEVVGTYDIIDAYIIDASSHLLKPSTSDVETSLKR